MYRSTRHRTLAVVAASAFAFTPSLGAAAEAGDWIFRGGITHISPDEDTDDVGGQLAPALAGSDVDVDAASALGLTGSYFVTDAIAVELLASSPFEHALAVNGGALDGTEVGDIQLLPPTLSAQYHFDTGTALRPYVGAGINYTLFFDEDVDSEAAGAGVTAIDVDNSFGPAAQVGLDYELGDGWLVNADLRYIDIDADTSIETATGTTDVDVSVDPWIASISVGYRF